EGLRVVERNVQRITAVTEALRSFTRHRSQGYARGEVNKVVDQVCVFMEMLCKKQGVRLKKALGQTAPVMLDADYLLGALYNLRANAVEAMPNGGVLTVTTAPCEAGVQLTIADTGAGMEPAVLEQIGRPFFTTKPAGTGLGLYVAREILAQHKAQLKIESTKG